MLKRYEVAVPFLERLVNASEDASTFHALLAATYMALGREEEAKVQIEKNIRDISRFKLCRRMLHFANEIAQ
jgi:Flp pilus assembly protein TadD